MKRFGAMSGLRARLCDEFCLRVQLRKRASALGSSAPESLLKWSWPRNFWGQLRVKIQELSILGSLLGAAR
jgi:hypothetical protein